MRGAALRLSQDGGLKGAQAAGGSLPARHALPSPLDSSNPAGRSVTGLPQSDLYCRATAWCANTVTGRGRRVIGWAERG